MGSSDYNLSKSELYFKTATRALDPDLMLIASPVFEEATA